MKLKDVEQTFVCQFSKPQNKKMLEGYVARRDRSGAELARYYADIVGVLVNTPAWGVSGVNKMVNELTASVRATLVKAKKGKTSAYAHANKMLNYIEHFGNEPAEAKYAGNYKLAALLSVEELEQLATLA
jgi:hypothetical protein